MELKLFQVDAFASRPFTGNPAAVVPLDSWIDDSLMQAIAEENNLSETAFFIKKGNDYQLRWFTPVEEVDLCGHATLASAHVIFKHLNHPHKEITFLTRSGALIVSQTKEGYQLDFPVSKLKKVEPPADLLEGLGLTPLAVFKDFDYVVIIKDEQSLKKLKPNLLVWESLNTRGIVVSAPSDNSDRDFVARCFFPGLDINEDPVTGSAYCELMPYWAAKLNNTSLTAEQLSPRSGKVFCELRGNRVLLEGQAFDYLKGTITV